MLRRLFVGSAVDRLYGSLQIQRPGVAVRSLTWCIIAAPNHNASVLLFGRWWLCAEYPRVCRVSK